ncbi:MAG: aldehyde ferredoxin oxidoreductase family protein [Methanomassiliicoccales archaeon]
MKEHCWQLLDIDLSDLSFTRTEIADDLKANYLGGEGLAVKLFTDAADPKIDPFSPRNPVVIAPGLLTGLPIPTASKTAFVSKSPLTGTIAESIMGGGIGIQMKMTGAYVIRITGKAKEPVILLIDNGSVIFESGSKYWGLSTREAEMAIKHDHGDYVVATIGPAGETLVRYACIDCEGRQAGRAGIGAVLGSKNLKAIGVRGNGDLPVYDAERLISLALKWQEIMEKSNAFIEDTKYGSGEFLEWVNSERGVFPTKNWKESVFDERKEIDPYYWAPKYSLKNKACFACTKACGKLFVIREGRYAGTLLDGIEYETLYALGGQCGNPDIEALAKANELCDLFGIDTISTGVVIGFVMELVERGLLSVKDIGIDCRFGNSEAVPKMVELIGKREGLGALFGEGVARIAKTIGGDSEDYALHVKGMEPPAYDVRGLKGMGLGFMTSSRGACHLRSGFYALDLTGKFWRFEGVDRLSTKDKGIMVKAMEDFMMIYDCLGICKFSRGFFKIEGFIDLISAAIGKSYTEEELLLIGERINNVKQIFNLRAGIGRESYRLPKRITCEPISSGASKGAVLTEKEAEEMLSEYFIARGWDLKGIPTKEKLAQLGLNHLINWNKTEIDRRSLES